MIIRVPHEWVVFILGEKLAPYLFEVQVALGLIIGIFIFIFGKKSAPKRRIKPNTSNKPIYVEINEDNNYVYLGEDKKNKATEDRIQETYFGQYDRYSDLTNEEMLLAMKIKVSRTEPTYEEWKAAREAEQHKEEQ